MFVHFTTTFQQHQEMIINTDQVTYAVPIDETTTAIHILGQSDGGTVGIPVKASFAEVLALLNNGNPKPRRTVELHDGPPFQANRIAGTD